MDFQHISALCSGSPLIIKNTSELSAKRLLAIFLAENNCVDTKLLELKSKKVIDNYVDNYKEKGLHLDLVNAIENIPFDVCWAFLEFLAECPNIHVTID